MNDQIKFEEPGMNYAQPPTGPQTSILTDLVMKLGIAKDAKQAQIVLIVVGITAFVLAGFMMFGSGGGASPRVPQPGESGYVAPAGSEQAPIDDAEVADDDLFNF